MTGTRRRLRPDERRAEILRAAQYEFSERPYSAVSVQDIAARAQASTGLVGFHFGSKRELYLECLRIASGELLDGLAALPGPPSIERLDAAVRLTVEHAAQHRAGYLALLRGAHEATFPEAAAEIENVRALIVQRILTSLGRPAEPATVLALRGHIGFVDAMIVTWLALPDRDRSAVDAGTIASLAVGAFRGALAALDRAVDTAH
jgi:AcrR family transcriptional regulator